MLGVDHSELGGRLLARWNFPLNMVVAVLFHHHPMAATPHQELAAYLHLGDMISHLVGYPSCRQALPLTGREEVLEILKLKGESLPGYMLETQVEFENICHLFNIGA